MKIFTPVRIVVAGMFLFWPALAALVTALFNGPIIAVYAAWLVWILDVVAIVAGVALHISDRKHAEQARVRADEALTVELKKIVDGEFSRIGDLY